jgi:hypothetical protein
MEHMIPRHPHQTGERCFLLGPLRAYITRPIEMSLWSGVELTVRQLEARSGAVVISDSLRGRETVNTHAEGSTALEAVTRQPVNTQQTEKT